MPWSNQNNHQNPWGQKKPQGQSSQEQPDLDEVMRRMQERFGGFFGGGSNGGGSSLNPSIVPWALGLALIAWLASGIYSVAADEEAVVLRFGQHSETKGPGLNWHLPFPIETIEKIPVMRVQRLEIGFRSQRDARVRKVERESLMLTKDENIVDISFTVQYKVKDVSEYLFNIDNAVKTVRDASESAIREVMGRTMIDAVLTDGKARVEVDTQDLIQEILDRYKAGISITTVKLQDVQPPARVIKEFKDVASAREDRERARNEAEAYANDMIPKARGEAKKMVLDAAAYSAEVIDRALGEAERFESLLTAYREAPELMRKRLYLETMEHVMAKTEKVIVGKAVAGQVLPYLPLSARAKVEVQ